MRTITLFVAILKRKTVTARVWVAVIGLVVYVSLYARPALSFLETLFHEADGYAPSAVFVPGRRALGELSALLACVPSCWSTCARRINLGCLRQMRAHARARLSSRRNRKTWCARFGATGRGGALVKNMMMRWWPTMSMYRRRAMLRPLRATQFRRKDAGRRISAALTAGSRCSGIRLAVAIIL